MYIVLSIICSLVALLLLIPLIINSAIFTAVLLPDTVIVYIAITFLFIFLAGLFAILARGRKVVRSLSCSYCGITNGTQYKFCGNCGVQLKR